MKKIIIFVFACMVAFSLAACEEITETGDETEGGPTGDMITTSSGLKIPEIVLANPDIEIMVIGEPLELMPEGAIYENFKEWYGAQLSIVTQSADAIFTSLATAVMSGESPDLVAGHGGFPDVMIQEIVVPVSGLVDYTLESMTHLQGAYNTYVFDDRNWMLPVDDIHTSAVFYNKSIMRNNDMETPRELFEKDEWTWDKLREYADELTLDETGDGTPDRWGLGMVNWHRGRFVLTTGENLIKIDGDEISSNLSSPNLERGYNFLFDLVFNDQSTSPNSDMYFVHTGLDNGEIAMIMTADFLALRPGFLRNLKAQDNLGFVPYPRDPQADIYTTAGYANGFYLPSGHRNPHGSAAFIYAAAATLSERYIPGEAMYERQLNENLAGIDGLEASTYARYVEWYNEYRQMTKITDAFNALIDPDEIFTAATPEGSLIGYRQAVAQVEPGLLERIDALKN